jgi:hypothetical protein
VIITTAYGTSFTVDGFSGWMRGAISEAGLPLDCKPLGLRKAAGRRAQKPARGDALGGCAEWRRGGSNIVLLTSLGGGAFGNDESWIEAGLVRALKLAWGLDLDVRLVSYGDPSPAFLRIERMFA